MVFDTVCRTARFCQDQLLLDRGGWCHWGKLIRTLFLASTCGPGLALDGGSLPNGIGGHFLLIKAYDVTEASTVQPFAYFQLVFASAVGMWAFGDVIDRYIVLGASIIVGQDSF